MKRICILASGNGSNTENLIKYFQGNHTIQISLIGSNNVNAKVLSRAKKYGIHTLSFNRKQLNSGDLVSQLRSSDIDFIVLAGFLLKIPKNIIEKYPQKIINIHPSLLPKYGGKGMYGKYVHEAVFKSQDKETGITIHFVNEVYDNGVIIFQAKCTLDSRNSIKAIMKKVKDLELKFFPIVIENILNEQN